MARQRTIPLYAGDDFETLADLRRELTIAERRLEEAKAEAEDAPRFAARAGDDEPSEAATVTAARAEVQARRDAYDAFVDEAAERAEEWVLEAIGFGQWRELLAEHPPREVPVEGEDGKTKPHPDDEGWNVDTSRFGKALLNFRQTDSDGDEFRTVTSPDLSADDLRRRIKRLSDGEFESLWTTAYLLNTGGIADPRAGKFSTTRESDET